MCKVSLSDSLPVSAKEKKRLAMQVKVRKAFADRGWTMLGEYVSSIDKIDFICDQGDRYSITWNMFTDGVGCKPCSIRKRIKPEGTKKEQARKLKRDQKEIAIQETVAKAFKIRKWIQLEKYKSVREKIPFICEKGHRHEIAWETLKRGAGLNGCYFVNQEIVEEAFTEIKWILRSKYTHSAVPLDYTCGRKHEGTIKWRDFVGGSRCQDCHKEDCRLSQEHVAQEFKKEGLIVTGEYINSWTPIKFTCVKASHDHAMSWDSFKAGSGCGQCNSPRRHDDESIASMLKKKNWTMRGSYKSGQKIKFTCENNHNHSMSLNNLRKGAGCRGCSIPGYKMDKPGTLYYIRFDLPGLSLWKIGITNNNVYTRFKSEKTPYSIIWERRYDDGSIPPALEGKILKQHKRYQYKGKLLESGNTECFIKDVLNQDSSILQLDFFAA
jgi:hypothetical protein